MTVTENNCVNLVFNTLEIYNIQPEDITDLSLVYSLNCAPTQTVNLITSKNDIIEATNSSLTGTNFTLTPQLLYDDETVEKFCEGVYYFQWSLTSEGTTYTFSICYFSDCEDKVKCKIVDYYSETSDPLPMFLYQALTLQVDCDTCSCENACKIYKKLSNLLNLQNVSTDGCGCS